MSGHETDHFTIAQEEKFALAEAKRLAMQAKKREAAEAKQRKAEEEKKDSRREEERGRGSICKGGKSVHFDATRGAGKAAEMERISAARGASKAKGCSTK